MVTRKTPPSGQPRTAHEKEVRWAVEIIIRAEAEEIAALVVGLQGRQMAELRDPLSGFNPQGDSLQHHSTSAKDS